MKRTENSEAERRFFATWKQQVPDSVSPVPEREFKFHATRDWRFDFAWPAARMALELEGRGRHQTVDGVRKDCEKHNEAVRLGWRVFYFPSTDKDEVLQWVEYLVESMHYV